MKFVTYSIAGSGNRAGIIVGSQIVDLQSAHRAARKHGVTKLGYLPSSVIELLRIGNAAVSDAKHLEELALNGRLPAANCVGLANATLLAPIPRPSSMRDGYAFRQHVEAARRNRGLDMIPEFDEIPIFYFTNHQAIYGPGNIPVLPLHLNKLDFELECAIVIGREGRNIPVSQADEYIAGYMVMNDWSARSLQMQEMKLNLGPAKGKDFATSLGPWLVTRDELKPHLVQTPHGEMYDLTMKAAVNGKDVSLGNLKDMSWTFAQIIERASYGVTLYPGDVIGSGTCGTGCFLELNGSKVYDPEWWLYEGDIVTCSIDALGTLENKIIMETP
ncbi:MAG: fumarylacetoacetate hydrolase family protein [Ignavibacteria bacterium]|nr:fumarylacetoacetate hydrolase family protein [Ignavibacteria bacterium]